MMEAVIAVAALCCAAVLAYVYVTPRKKQEQSFGVSVMDTEGGRLFRLVGIEDRCPDCQQRGFYRGPAGGMSRNVYCMNRDCRSGFNLTYLSLTEGTCDRIGKIDDEHYELARGVRWNKEMA